MKLSVLKKASFIQWFVLIVVSVLSAFLLVKSELAAYTADELKEIGASITGGLLGVYGYTILQVMAITTIAWVIAVLIAKKVNLKLFELKLSKSKLIKSIIVGIGLAVIVMGIDIFVFGSLQYLTFEPYSSSYLVFYSGILEEIWFRACLVSVFTFILWKLFCKGKSEVPKWVYYIAVVLGMGVMLAIQIPMVQANWGLTFWAYIRCFFLYVLPSLTFGTLYIKQGLTYSVISHIVMQIVGNFILIPLVLALF